MKQKIHKPSVLFTRHIQQSEDCRSEAINFNPENETNITNRVNGYFLTFVDDLKSDNIY